MSKGRVPKLTSDKTCHFICSIIYLLLQELYPLKNCLFHKIEEEYMRGEDLELHFFLELKKLCVKNKVDCYGISPTQFLTILLENSIDPGHYQLVLSNNHDENCSIQPIQLTIDVVDLSDIQRQDIESSLKDFLESYAKCESCFFSTKLTVSPNFLFISVKKDSPITLNKSIALSGIVYEIKGFICFSQNNYCTYKYLDQKWVKIQDGEIDEVVNPFLEENTHVELILYKKKSNMFTQIA